MPPSFGSIDNFYPRPPRGGRRPAKITAIAKSKFLSTPSARRATDFLEVRLFWVFISIHALREEGDPHPEAAADYA